MPDGLLAGSIYMIVGSEMHLEEKVDTLHINVPTLNKQPLTSFGLEKQPQRLGQPYDDAKVDNVHVTLVPQCMVPYGRG